MGEFINTLETPCQKWWTRDQPIWDQMKKQKQKSLSSLYREMHEKSHKFENEANNVVDEIYVFHALAAMSYYGGTNCEIRYKVLFGDTIAKSVWFIQPLNYCLFIRFRWFQWATSVTINCLHKYKFRMNLVHHWTECVTFYSYFYRSHGDFIFFPLSLRVVAHFVVSFIPNKSHRLRRTHLEKWSTHICIAAHEYQRRGVG